jgi:hypothetical protein
MAESQRMSFVKACRNYFGQLPGQTLQQFAEELKCLSTEDRKELCAMFGTVGIEIEEVKG